MKNNQRSEISANTNRFRTRTYGFHSGRLSVTNPSPAGTSLGECANPNHARRPADNIDGFGTRTERLDLSSDEAVSGSSAVVIEITSLPIDDPADMLMTRDLSATRRVMSKDGCMEDGRDA